VLVAGERKVFRIVSVNVTPRSVLAAKWAEKMGKKLPGLVGSWTDENPSNVVYRTPTVSLSVTATYGKAAWT